jgi:hypothetical protein
MKKGYHCAFEYIHNKHMDLIINLRSGLTNSKMGVNTCISSCPSQIFVLSAIQYTIVTQALSR